VSLLGESIPRVGIFFINFVMLQSASFFLKNLQIGRMIVVPLKQKFLCVTPRDFKTAEGLTVLVLMVLCHFIS
jgi:hypothetical protein